MAGEKTAYSIDLNDAQSKFLDSMVQQYDLPDRSKVVRCLIDYAARDGDKDVIFDTIRCLYCG